MATLATSPAREVPAPTAADATPQPVASPLGRNGWRGLALVMLLLAIPALLPLGRSAELPVLVGAIAGLWLALRDPALRGQPAFRLATLLFLGYWLPQLVSAPDALDA